MKKLLCTSLVLALVAGAAGAQFPGAQTRVEQPLPHAAGSSGTGTCGTRPTDEDAAALRYLHEQGAYDPQVWPEYVFSVPVTLHVVRRTNGSGGVGLATLNAGMSSVNAAFLATGIQFVQQGPVDFIDSDAFYFGIDSLQEIDALRSTNVVPGTINVYYTQNLATATQGLCGISSFTTSPVQGIVMANACTSATGSNSILVHEFGHYFDLFHTHETAFGLECPDGSNCGAAGDLLCDTPADPNLSGDVNGACQYVGGWTRCGQPFDPDPSNFMSYSPEACLSTFTAGQRNRALSTLVNLRPWLIAAPGLQVTWVDFGHSGAESGTYQAPFDTVAEAVQATNPGGRVVIKAGSSSETSMLDPAGSVTIDSFRGPSTVGH